MATFSLFENIVISTPEEAEAFVRAIEQSIEKQKEAQKNNEETDNNFRLATREDIIRLQKLREQNNYGLKDESCR